MKICAPFNVCQNPQVGGLIEQMLGAGFQVDGFAGPDIEPLPEGCGQLVFAFVQCQLGLRAGGFDDHDFGVNAVA